MKILTALLFFTLSLNLFGQRERSYFDFDFFKLEPIERAYLKKNKNYKVIESDSLLSVRFSGDGENLNIKIFKESAPYSENVEVDCCSGVRWIARRFYYSDSIVEYNYKFPVPLTKKGKDTIVVETKRVITQDSIYLSYYEIGFEVSLNYDSIFSLVEKGNFKITKWRNFKVLPSYSKLFVEESNSWSKEKKQGYLYCGSSFKVGWWDYKRWSLGKTPTIFN
jgi:hypothetical protein